MQKVQTLKNKPRSAKSRAAANTSWQITNSTDTDLLVVSTSSDTDHPEWQSYAGPLQAVSAADGSKVIGKGKTGTVAADENAGSIILARADNLFPVKAVAVNDGTQSSSVTATAADAERLKLAAKFLQLLAAFPSSSLATDFATALADSDPAKAAAFFGSTDDYKTLTIDDVVAVQTYYAAYPFVWAYYGAGKNYGLHSTDGTTNQYVGYLALTNACAIPLRTDKTVPGFTATYVNGDTSIPLYYSNGQFVDDVNSAGPGICLQGLFVLKSSLTKSDDDTVIVAVLIGTINGETVLGYDEEQTVQNDGQLRDVQSSLDILLHPQDTQGWLELAGVILATVLGFGVLCLSIKAIVDQATKVTPLTPEQTRDRIREITQRNLDRFSDIKGLPDNQRLTIPKEVTASLDAIKAKGNKVLLEENRTKLKDILQRQEEICTEIAKGGAPDSLELIADDMIPIGPNLEMTFDSRYPEKFEAMIETCKTQLYSITDQLTACAAEIWDHLETNSKNIINESKEAIKEASGQVDEMEKMRQDLTENRSPEERKFEELFESF